MWLYAKHSHFLVKHKRPKLNLLKLSNSSATMDIRNSLSATESSKLWWKMLWMKLKKQKKKLFEFALPLQVPYDYLSSLLIDYTQCRVDYGRLKGNKFN